MNSDVIRISTEKMIEMASAKSSSSGGSGRISTTRMVSTPTASATSPRRSSAMTSAGRGNLKLLPPWPAVTSVMPHTPARLFGASVGQILPGIWLSGG